MFGTPSRAPLRRLAENRRDHVAFDSVPLEAFFELDHFGTGQADEILAQSLPDVGPNQRLIAAKTKLGRDLFQVLDHVFGNANADRRHGPVAAQACTIAASGKSLWKSWLGNEKTQAGIRG